MLLDWLDIHLSVWFLLAIGVFPDFADVRRRASLFMDQHQDVGSDKDGAT